MTVYLHQKKWMYDFWYTKIRFRQGGFITKTQALKAEKEARKSAGNPNSHFKNICEKRLEELKIRRTDRYYHENRRLIEKLLKLWGDKPITRQDVEGYANKTALKSVSQANKELKMIKRLFQHAKERDWIETNPAQNIKLFPVSKKRKYIPPQEDIIRFLMEAGKDRFYFLVMIFTLARMREINYLKWEDVFDDYLILKTRKARNSDLTERKIPINATLGYVLGKIPKKGSYVFCKENGEPFDCRKKLMAGICKRAEIKPFSFHSLRHFGASKLMEAGAPLTAVQAILGHSRATTTDTYLQSLGTKKNEVMNNLMI